MYHFEAQDQGYKVMQGDDPRPIATCDNEAEAEELVDILSGDAYTDVTWN